MRCRPEHKNSTDQRHRAKSVVVAQMHCWHQVGLAGFVYELARHEQAPWQRQTCRREDPRQGQDSQPRAKSKTASRDVKHGPGARPGHREGKSYAKRGNRVDWSDVKLVLINDAWHHNGGAQNECNGGERLLVAKRE